MEAFTKDFPPEVDLGNNRKIRHEQGRSMFTVNAPQAVIIGLFIMTLIKNKNDQKLSRRWAEPPQ